MLTLEKQKKFEEITEEKLRSLPFLLGSPELQKLTGKSHMTINPLMKSKNFPSIKIGGRYYVTVTAFLEWIKKQQEYKNAS